MRALLPSGLFEELTSWHRDIDELFNRFFASAPGSEDTAVAVMGWWPGMESFVKDGQYCIRLDLPGIDPNDVDLSVVENMLVIKGERKRTSEVEERNYYHKGITYGRFEQRFALPKGVDREKITARYEHGVLEILVPATELLPERKVPIEIGGGEVKQLKAA